MIPDEEFLKLQIQLNRVSALMTSIPCVFETGIGDAAETALYLADIARDVLEEAIDSVAAIGVVLKNQGEKSC